MPETLQNSIKESNSGHSTVLVSVIVPIYNAERYLRECLDSVSTQTYRNFEVLMINDGSRDNSADICREYETADPRFRLINRENGGVSVARNTGIEQSVGEYICFIDADDIMHPQAIETLVSAVDISDADLAYSLLDFGVAARFSAVNNSTLSRLRVYHSYMILESGLYQSIMINSVCGAMLRRSVFDSGLRFSIGRRYEDLDIFYKLILASRKVAYLPEKLYFYRQHPDSFIQKFAPARLDVLDVTDEMLTNISALSVPALEKAARDRRFSAYFNIWILLIANDIELPEVENRCVSVIHQERMSEILNPRVRLKNKLGALASYGGRRLVRMLIRFVS